MRTSVSKVAQTLLRDNTFDIEFHGYLSNHAKHAIVALDGLQATESRIQEYWDEYTTVTPYNLSLHKARDWQTGVQPLRSREEFEQVRGQKTNWQEQVLFLQGELQERFHGDTNQLVQTYATPDLLSGMAGALTHGIIHLGWAIDANSNPWMVCEGLAYLNFCHLGVDNAKFTTKEIDGETPLLDSLIRVAQTFEEENLATTWVSTSKQNYDESFHPELVPAGFQWQVAKVIEDVHPVATAIPTSLVPPSLTTHDETFWKSVYQSIVTLYLATRDQDGNGNFVVLHAITMLWALEQTVKVINNDETTRLAIQQYYANLICILATAGFPSSTKLLEAKKDYFTNNDSNPVVVVDWEPVVQRGIAEIEEHNIKLVYVTQELWHRFGHWNGFYEAGKSFTLTPNIGPRSTTFSAENQK